MNIYKNTEVRICVICKQNKPIVKFDQMTTKAEGRIRRKTCRQCNLGIGAFRDNPDLLIKAANYIQY
ncbi:MAG: endonuclease domain-containing protein, partial [Nanoarchaeota archaeon]